MQQLVLSMFLPNAVCHHLRAQHSLVKIQYTGYTCDNNPYSCARFSPRSLTSIDSKLPGTAGIHKCSYGTVRLQRRVQAPCARALARVVCLKIKPGWSLCKNQNPADGVLRSVWHLRQATHTREISICLIKHQCSVLICVMRQSIRVATTVVGNTVRYWHLASATFLRSIQAELASPTYRFRLSRAWQLFTHLPRQCVTSVSLLCQAPFRG